MMNERRKHDPQLKAQILADIAGGRSAASAAHCYGVSAGTIGAWLHRLRHKMQATDAKQLQPQQRKSWNAPPLWSVPPGKLSGRNRYVYLVREEFRGLVKIGVAANVRARLSTMQTGCPQIIEVLACVASTKAHEIERNLHILLSDKRYRGEWFELCDSDIQMVFELLAQKESA